MPKSNDPTLLFVLGKKPSAEVESALTSISDALGHIAGYSIITIDELQKCASANLAGLGESSNLDGLGETQNPAEASSFGEHPNLDKSSNQPTTSNLSKALAFCIEKIDPWSVVALDESAIDELRHAFGEHSSALQTDNPVQVCGYTLVAVPDFESCLEDEEQKRIAWKRLKAARHPKNPLD